MCANYFLGLHTEVSAVPIGIHEDVSPERAVPALPAALPSMALQQRICKDLTCLQGEDVLNKLSYPNQFLNF